MRFSDLVNALEANGFFESVLKIKIGSVKQEILSSKFLFPEATGRGYLADAEDLAEQGALKFIVGLAPQLAQRGVHLPVVSVPRRPLKIRDPKTGEIIEVNHFKLQADDSIPDKPGITYLRPVKEELPESGEFYRVVIGSRVQEIWNNQFSPEQYWEAGMRHTFILVNQLLQDAGAQERIYGLYGGNDGYAVFLTPEQFKLIRECEDIKDSYKPWEANIVK